MLASPRVAELRSKRSFPTDIVHDVLLVLQLRRLRRLDEDCVSLLDQLEWEGFFARSLKGSGAFEEAQNEPHRYYFRTVARRKSQMKGVPEPYPLCYASARK